MVIVQLQYEGCKRIAKELQKKRSQRREAIGKRGKKHKRQEARGARSKREARERQERGKREARERQERDKREAREGKKYGQDLLKALQNIQIASIAFPDRAPCLPLHALLALPALLAIALLALPVAYLSVCLHWSA
jgi:hypothetical protein